VRPEPPSGTSPEEEFARRWLRFLRIMGIALVCLVAIVLAMEFVLWLTWGGLEPFGRSGG